MRYQDFVKVFINSILLGKKREHLCTPLSVFCDKSLQQKSFIFNQLDFESNLFKDNSWNFKVAKVTGSSQVLRFVEITFRTLKYFLPKI